jgi:hypothetical protein
MVFPEPMTKRIDAYQEGKRYHAIFEERIPDNIKAKNR